jgi:hypothetical protein
VVASGPSANSVYGFFLKPVLMCWCLTLTACRAVTRSAIEEELEVLYDAYYDELEQYANIQQRYVASGGAHPPPPGPGPFPGSVELDKDGAVIGAPRNTRASAKQPQSHPPQVNGRKSGKHPSQESEFDDDEQDDEEFEEDEEYEEDEEDDDDDDEDDDPEEDDPDEIPPAKPRTGARAHGGRDRRAAPNGKAAHSDGLFNFGNSLAVTGAWAIVF